MTIGTQTMDYYRNALIEFGAHKIAHRDEKMIDHLEQTYSILNQMNCPAHVCLAGLFHGVYGTQALHAEKAESMAEGLREKVAEIIGDQAERLVFTFSILNYDSLGKSFRSMLKPNGEPELKDRRTGQPIPMSRAEFDDLLKLKLGDFLAHIPRQRTQSFLDPSEEYKAFWEIAAEYLGDDCVKMWNSVAAR